MELFALLDTGGEAGGVARSLVTKLKSSASRRENWTLTSSCKAGWDKFKIGGYRDQTQRATAEHGT